MTWLPTLLALADRSGEERERFLFAHPELLGEDAQDALRAELDQAAEHERVRVEPTLAEVVARRESLVSRAEPYPIDAGPVEGLWTAVLNRELDADHADALARRHAARAVTAQIYVQAIRSGANQIRRDGGRDAALLMLRLLLAALEERPGGPVCDQAGRDTCLTFADHAAALLNDRADGRLFTRARELVEPVVAWARASGDRGDIADALSTAGRLHLVPWASSRRIDENLELILWRWEQRFIEEHRDELAGVPEEVWRMPPADEALRKAHALLREAADLLDGHERGLALKQCVDAAITLDELDELDVEVDREDLFATAQEALRQLDADRDPEARLVVINALRRMDLPVDLAEVEAHVTTSVDELVRRHGLSSAADVLRQTSLAMARESPTRAFEVCRHLSTLTGLIGTAESRESLWVHQLALSRSGYAYDLRAPADQEAHRAAASDLRERAAAEQWDVIRLAGGLLYLARASANVDAEEYGLELLEEARKLVPAYALEHADALAYFEAELHLGLGANAYHARSFEVAIKEYETALDAFLELELPARALDMVGRLRDCVLEADPDVAVKAALSVGTHHLALESALGDSVVLTMQALYKHALARLGPGSVNPEAFVLMLQMAKSQRFGAQLHAGVRYVPGQDRTGRDLLERIAEAESEAGTTEPGAQASVVDSDLLLTAYLRPDSPRHGDAPADRLSNLRHAYDAHLNKQLIGVNPSAVYLPTATVQDALDDRTVMLVLYIGASAEGNLAVSSLAVTSDDMRVMTVNFPVPDRLDLIEQDGRTLLIHPFANLVQTVREKLADAPEPHVATREALDWLDRGRETWFGDLLDGLPEWREAGKDHLCIVPHGPLHAYPFHLIPVAGEALASDWIVSYLPSLQLLLADHRAGLHRPHPRPVATFGLSYDDVNPFGLTPLPQARTEAETIARQFDLQPVLDEDVTEERVTDGLLQARWVHLAAHGRHDVEAPAFQCLYLTPSEGYDGRMSAHELLAYDLRGLELVTLSACETALGRFDVADNLTGLPAALLLAGVETLVGTLWPVETNASEHFFRQLYGALGGGAGRLNAFAHAQRSTRTAFPAYRDWGPFYYVGEWR